MRIVEVSCVAPSGSATIADNTLNHGDGALLLGFITAPGTTAPTTTADLALKHDDSGIDVLKGQGANVAGGAARWVSDLDGPVPLKGSYTLEWTNNDVLGADIKVYLFLSRVP